MYARVASVFPFIRSARFSATTAPGGSCSSVCRADQHASGRSEPLEPRRRVDRVADERIGDVAVAADLAEDDLAAVHADAQLRPLGVRGRERRDPLLQGERGARGGERVVGLVAAGVERGDDRVADELLEVAAQLARDQRRGDAPVRVEHRRDLRRRSALGVRREADEVAEEHADLLLPLARRREVERPEALVAPLAAGGVADHEVRRDDQAVPLPPARMPLALAGERDADHRLREEQEARDDGRRQELPALAEEREVAGRADGVDERADDRDEREEDAARGLAVGTVERRQPRDRPDEPDRHREQHRRAQERAAPDQPRRDRRVDVDERGRSGEPGADEEADRDRDLEARVVAGEEDAGSPVGVDHQEPAGGHEREREELHARVAATVGGLAGHVAERERAGADDAEDDEVEAVVLEVRIEVRPQQERHEADERQRRGHERSRDDGGRPPARPHVEAAAAGGRSSPHTADDRSLVHDRDGTRERLEPEDDPGSSSRTIRPRCPAYAAIVSSTSSTRAKPACAPASTP